MSIDDIIGTMSSRTKHMNFFQNILFFQNKNGLQDHEKRRKKVCLQN